MRRRFFYDVIAEDKLLHKFLLGHAGALIDGLEDLLLKLLRCALPDLERVYEWRVGFLKDTVPIE